MKRLVIVIFIIFASFLTFSLYKTFAYDTSVVEETPSTTDLEYTFKIGNSSIKQITVDSGETKYYDVVLGNPNLAKISYGVYYEMVSPSRNPDGFSIEYTSKSTGASTGKVDKEGNITLNLVVTNTSSSSVTVKLGTVAGYVNGGDLKLNSNQQFISKEPLPKATEVIKTLDDGTTGDSGSGVYKVHHETIPANSSATGEIIEATDDYRYYGKNPNNYICLDKNSDNTCEDRHLYRIIGSMREDSDNIYKLKVIKATPLISNINSNYAWDTNGSNIWATNSNSLTSGSSLMIMLNSGAWWNKTGEFENYGFENNVKNFISKSRYYLGGFHKGVLLTDKRYLLERGTISNPLYWNGYVGLLYPSDYGYASGKKCYSEKNLSMNRGNYTCYQNYWLITSEYFSEYAISPSVDDSYVFNTMDGKTVNDDGTASESSIRPTFYLKPEVVITGGTGEETNPYTVSIE